MIHKIVKSASQVAFKGGSQVTKQITQVVQQATPAVTNSLFKALIQLAKSIRI